MDLGVHMRTHVCVCVFPSTVYNGSVSRIRIKLLIGFLNDITTASESCSEAARILRNQAGYLQANVQNFY